MISTIGVISDTHGLLRPEAISAINDCDMIIHAGDIGGQGVLEKLEEIAPVHAVRGNMDKGHWAVSLPLTDVIEINGYFIYVLHDLGLMDLDPSASKFGMVVSGHSHRPELFEENSVLYLNPGSAGPRRFSLPASIAKVTVSEDGLHPEFVNLDKGE